ncbi:ATP-binding protein [Tenacibaculum sp. 190524A05c]|uniref:tetratricopeptide repeat-containing sensor histidine kinase n=1 Tax=Tenacibaculum platacis TaxID=3137852 RepID=UPI0032B30DFB
MRFFLIAFIVAYSSYSQKRIDSITAKVIDDGLKSYRNKDSLGLKKSINKLYELSNSGKDSLVLAKYFHYKALSYRVRFQYDSAYYYYNTSKSISKDIGDSLNVGRRLLSMAVMQRRAKDYLGSEISSVEALQYLEPIKSYTFLESVYNNLGLVSEELNQDREAIKYYKQAYKISELIEDKSRKEVSFLRFHNNLGLLYQQDSIHNTAVEYFRKGLQFDSLKEKHPIHYALLLENLTYSSIALGKKGFAEENYNEVIQIRENQKDYSDLCITHVLLSEFYTSEKRVGKAKFHANQALEYAKETHNNKRWLQALQKLSELSTVEESNKYLREYMTLNDSLFQQERQLKNQFAKIRYETDKTEKENKELKVENEKTLAEAELQKQRATIGLLLSGISIMFLLSSISFFRFRRKKLLFQSQLQKIEAREQERRQIAKSLHDEVAGDLRLLHRKLEKSFLLEEAQKLELVKDNVRNLSHQLSSVSFEDVPFRDQILNLVSDYFSPDFIIKVNGLKEIDWSEANKSIKRLLYLSLRECIQNCQKYAEASKMTINFSIHKKSVFLDVADNGKGFDTATQKKGIGLLNLQERVQDLNGTLTIESEVGKGTKIIIQTPLNA